MADYFGESGFKVFAEALEKRLETYKKVPKAELLRFQRKQLKNLIGLENKFRKVLIAHKNGPVIYKKFIEHILKSKNGILAARPYFRERQTIFSSEISPALKKKSDRGLYKFRFNFNFILFALQNAKWGKNCEIIDLANQIKKQRQELLEMNTPLAMSQCRIFWASTPRSHLSYMDLMQIHCMGLLIAIDKFVPPKPGLPQEQELQEYRKFRAVAIGRMMGDRVEEFSATLLHFYPGDKRKIYRALKTLRHQSENVDMGVVAERVNEGIENPKHRTNANELIQLLAGASHVSGDMSVDPEGETTLERYSDTVHDEGLVAQVDDFDALGKIHAATKHLDVVETKILKMKGMLR